MNGTKQIVENRVNPDWLCYFLGIVWYIYPTILVALVLVLYLCNDGVFSDLNFHAWVDSRDVWSDYQFIYFMILCLVWWWSCFAADIWTRMLYHVHQIEFQNDKLRTRKERALYNLNFSPNAMWNYCVSR